MVAFFTRVVGVVVGVIDLVFPLFECEVAFFTRVVCDKCSVEMSISNIFCTLAEDRSSVLFSKKWLQLWQTRWSSFALPRNFQEMISLVVHVAIEHFNLFRVLRDIFIKSCALFGSLPPKNCLINEMGTNERNQILF